MTKEYEVAARVAADVTHTDKLAVAKNAATNARWFCVGIALLAAHMGYPGLSLNALIAIGMSVPADLLPNGFLKRFAAMISYTIAVLTAVSLALNIW